MISTNTPSRPLTRLGWLLHAWMDRNGEAWRCQRTNESEPCSEPPAYQVTVREDDGGGDTAAIGCEAHAVEELTVSGPERVTLLPLVEDVAFHDISMERAAEVAIEQLLLERKRND